jgi:D-alanyl-D-alanine carboxypeptidase (penicillin-binding protein 5/6)
MYHRLFAYGLLLCFCFASSAIAETAVAETKPPSAQAPSSGQTTTASHAVLVDATTGDILFGHNEHQTMPTSSMSKTMTMYMVFDALKKGTLKLDDQLLVSEKAWSMQGSKTFVPLNEKVAVEDLIKGVIIQSGNDATIVLAEGVAGTEAAFVDAMNKKAKEIGMTNSNFMNASGWPDPSHYSTPVDLAILGYRLIKDFPEYYHYYSQQEFTYHNIHQRNRNPLLYMNIGADGIKTGHTEVAGFGLMGSAVQNNRRLIVVLNGMKSNQERGDEAARLLDWGFRNFETMAFHKAGDVLEQAPVWLGTAATVGLEVSDDVLLTVYKPEKDKTNQKVIYNSPLKAPIVKDQVVGKLVITLANGKNYEYPLKAANDVPRLGFFKRALAQLKYLIFGE